ncbi:MAG: efflux RND transporter periplasmic adaptor subunit [Saprospiraceae bacterium]|nr:efflux RND transporter periplasmic adaptor subunit [Saprospiraceae bacterium]HRG33699.1 efflux RND transporter periplasmic adaptor subunit [Saprospiraceae bacterium]
MKRIVILLYLTSIFIHSGCRHEKHEKELETNFLVTSPIEMDTILYREYVAQIQSINHIELRSQERGYLQNIYVDEGQSVKKGQLMFQIMPLLYQAELQKAQAEYNFSEIEYKNTKNLADSNIVSPNELALAKAHLDKVKADLALAQTHLDFTNIRAPFDGIMGRFNVRLGSLVDEGELLTTLSDNSKMWVYFNVPESEYLDYVKKVKSDSTLKVKLKMANNDLFDYSGKVETIEADFNNETGNIAFRATFPNPKGILRHGETGNILMPVSLKDAIIIPQKATFDVLDKKYVYIVGEDNSLKATQIIIGQEMPHVYVVASGLTTKDKILAEGLGKVKNDEKIQYKIVSFEKELAELNNLHAE